MYRQRWRERLRGRGRGWLGPTPSWLAVALRRKAGGGRPTWGQGKGGDRDGGETPSLPFGWPRPPPCVLARKHTVLSSPSPSLQTTQTINSINSNIVAISSSEGSSNGPVSSSAIMRFGNSAIIANSEDGLNIYSVVEELVEPPTSHDDHARSDASATAKLLD